MDEKLWQQYRQFQQELDALKQEMERIAEIRRELAKLGAISDEDIAF